MRWGTEVIGPLRADGSRSSCGVLPPTLSPGTAAQVTHDRTVARLPIAHTRQVTVTRIICGVDICSASLQARIGRNGAAGSFANNPEGIAALAAFCQTHQVELVAMEATGGYEQQPFALLSEQGLAVTILNPRAVRRFAEGMGVLEKTDALDAGLIAWFAEVKGSQPQSLSSTSRSNSAPWSPVCASSPKSAPRSATSCVWSVRRRYWFRLPNCSPWWPARYTSWKRPSPN